MAKNKKRARSRQKQRRRTTPEVGLLDALSAGIEAPTPGPLLGIVSLALSVAAADDDPAAAFGTLVRSFSAADRVETSAALLAIATLTVDPDLRRRVRREIAERGHVLPQWLAELHRSEPVDRAVEVSTVFRDVDELLVGVTVPGGGPLTAVIAVNNEFGAVATDGYVVGAPLDEVVGLMVEGDDPDLRVRDISPADARARLTHALSGIDRRPLRLASEQLTEARPLVEWMLSLLPEGGQDTELRELSEEELDGIAEAFLASPSGPPWARSELRPLVDEVLAVGSGNGIGDPLVWSRRNVRALLDLEQGFLDPAVLHVERIPELLSDLIRYGHAERGLRPQLTADALSEVDARADAFRAALRALADDEA
ncbi:hypothetical protein SAMN04515665_13035 [Blastococcus sp. DSM 46786]|uniref:hypothetical protein n=1 Tax=Blastococcus sp. DSM 46786 TaxID=1798227 RepID=UPI0008C7A615|nr:hypothetical protein [Blastococcus sp. DSM 46786]SEM09800.1 hypothetical protein SAMN04515665_13035 [Blastococcus sp. DSM 46786]